MSREPFILIEPPETEGSIYVAQREINHLIRVLRVKPGYRLTGFDGRGNGWIVEITEINRQQVKCRIIKPLAIEPERELYFYVGVSIVKGFRMDQAVEKAAEIGADTFIPLLTDRSVVSPGAVKIERWRNIALAAAKQSRRLSLMKIENPMRLTDYLRENLNRCQGAVPDSNTSEYSVNRGRAGKCDFTMESLIQPNETIEKSTKPFIIWALDNSPGARKLVDIYKAIKLPSDLTLLIGPEGGFSPEEIKLFKEERIPLVSMGQRPLRTETAVTVALGTLANLSGSK
ncbi:MAG: RsmE family RNA methyltransferase [Candidatus Hatepunaea meridiana]|nr:RsmE family RNA methyltransferase [Candidatus Hatepunaea meridiana]